VTVIAARASRKAKAVGLIFIPRVNRELFAAFIETASFTQAGCNLHPLAAEFPAGSNRCCGYPACLATCQFTNC
jgi:hypothetical protein